MSFKTGDKVRAIKSFEGRRPSGIGTIARFWGSDALFEVKFPDGSWNYKTENADEYLVHETSDSYVFKVGDYVEHTEDGTKGVVIDPPKGNTVRIIVERGTVHYWNTDMLKHVDHPVHDGKFQFGERVVRARRDNGAAARVGQEATVIQAGSIRVVYPGSQHFNESRGRYGEGWDYVNVDCVPIDSKHEETKHMFKPGDRVVRINCSNGGCAQVGQEADVVYYDSSKSMVYVTYPGFSNDKHGGEGWVAYNTKLIATSSGNTTEHTTTSKEHNPTFKPGDRVRVMRKAKSFENGWKNSWVSSMNDAVGKEFEVVRTSTGGVYFKTRSEGFPPFVLELVTAETTHNPETTKEPVMLKIEDRVYINNTNAKDYAADDLIRTITEAEKEIAKLKAIETKSSAIGKRIAELEAGTKRLAELLDARD